MLAARRLKGHSTQISAGDAACLPFKDHTLGVAVMVAVLGE
jgi:hypothetical protein